MGALTNVIEEKTIKKRILPSRSGDDRAQCAIAKLVLAQAQISNQQKPKHKNYVLKSNNHPHMRVSFTWVGQLFKSERAVSPY